ncbi:hypothetical protein [Paenibacillus marinisediminis]
MEVWKQEIFQRAFERGIAKDPQWVEQLNEPVPLWVLLDILLRLSDTSDHPHKPFD